MSQIISGTITEEFNISDVSESDKSGAIVEIGNFSCKLEVKWFTDNNVEYLAVFADCSNSINSNLWSCKARVTLNLKKTNGNELSSTFSQLFHINALSWGYNRFIQKEVLILPSNDYVTDGKFKIVANIQILEVAGFRMRRIDFSIPRNIETEIELNVGNRKLYVDNYVLMCFSSVFRGSVSAGKSNGTVDSLENFETFLAILYHENQQITDKNVESLLKLAEQYGIEFLTAYCEDYLISSKTVKTAEKLRLSEVYKLSELQLNVIEKLTRAEIKKLDGKMRKVGSLTAKALLVKMLEGRAREKESKFRKFLINCSVALIVNILIVSFVLTLTALYLSIFENF